MAAAPALPPARSGVLAQRFIHFTNSPLKSVGKRTQTPDAPGNGKPNGLFCAPGAQWRSWTRRQGEPCGSLAYEVTLAPAANILVLDAASWRAHHNKYGLPRVPEIAMASSRFDWSKAAQDGYHGVYVAFHELEPDESYEQFLERGWVTWWDVDTLVVWDPAAVRAVRLVQDVVEAT